MSGKDSPLIIRVPKDQAGKTDKLFAYLVDQQGKLAERAAFKDGQAQFKTTFRAIHGRGKVFLAPALPADLARKPVTEKMLIRLGAYQPHARLTADNIFNVRLIPDLERFLLRRCLITGNVTKTFNIAGTNVTVPICDVRVHICEVDPVFIILPKIPDWEIIDIRDRLLDVIIHEKFPRLPDPPLPDPIGPVTNLRRAPLKLNLKRELKLRREEMRLFNIPALPDEVITGLSSPSLRVVRDTLKDHFHLLRPIFCYFPRRWPWLYRCDEIAVVYPDCNGHFEHPYWYLALGDRPDIYIWVEANIDGVWQTVYKPGKACGTHWNYECGTEINVRITDERVHPCECAPMPGSVVWIKRVNDGISIRNIRQDSSAAGHLADVSGLVPYVTSDPVSPFGGSFPFVIQFGSGFPSAAVTHYRWKYRQIKDASLNNVVDEFHPYESILHKAYTYERVNSEGDTVFYTGSFQLGPIPTATDPIYRIPHVEASVDVPAEPTAEWNQDTYSIYLDSNNMNDGLYEFVLELVNGAGNVVPLDADTFVVDKKAGEVSNPPDAPTITADGRPENYLLKNGAGKAIGFRFLIRFDNDICFAEIQDALVDGVATNSVCGFGQYANKATSEVTLAFEASHPQDFATYAFSVVKGNGNPAGPTDTNGYLTQVNNGYSLAGDEYSKDVPVSAMLGTCSQAAFAENLHVHALHTNGNRRLWEYDRDDTAAFAIEPVDTVPTPVP